MYFTRCGFDPRVRGIVSAETGVDAGKGFLGLGSDHGSLFSIQVFMTAIDSALTLCPMLNSW